MFEFVKRGVLTFVDEIPRYKKTTIIIIIIIIIINAFHATHK